MTLSDFLLILRRRWRFFIGSFLVYAIVTVAVTLALPRSYDATATLFVGTGNTTTSPDQLVRTYAALARNPNIAEAVVRELPYRFTRGALLERMTFTPVDRTQLLEITGSAPSAQEARTLANTYASVFAQRVADLVASRSVRDRVAVSEGAALPGGPSRPNRPLFIGFGLLLSLLLAAAVVALRESRQTSLSLGADDPLHGVPVLGRIPRFKRRRAAGGDSVDDAFQWLRTSLDAVVQERRGIIVVTSPSPGDGKSTVVAHLALAMSDAGQRVLVVEADLRRPGLERTRLGTGVERAETGLTDALIDGHAIEPSSHPDWPRVQIVWAGRSVANTAPLLDLGIGAVLRRLQLRYDHVIVDTPPLSVGADAAIVASVADGVLLVVDVQRTTPASIRAALERLSRVDAAVLGTVLNRTGLEQHEDYYRAPSARRAVGLRGR